MGTVKSIVPTAEHLRGAGAKIRIVYENPKTMGEAFRWKEILDETYNSTFVVIRLGNAYNVAEIVGEE